MPWVPRRLGNLGRSRSSAHGHASLRVSASTSSFVSPTLRALRGWGLHTEQAQSADARRPDSDLSSLLTPGLPLNWCAHSNRPGGPTMPRTDSSNPFLKMNHLDLAYAMARLVRLGKTDASQVRTLAAERKMEIEQLEARVAALKAAVDIDAPAPAKRKYTRRKVRGRAGKVAKGAKRPVGRPRGSKNKPKVAKGTELAKRVVKNTQKMAAARKLQGRYMGLRRQLSPQLQEQATKIAQADGVAAAVKFIEAQRAAA